LSRVVTLVPSDQVAANFLKGLQTSGRPELATQPTPQAPPIDPSEVIKPIDHGKVVGVWNASRSDGSKFSLKLNADKSFTWSFEPNQNPPQSFDGTYTLTNNVVTLNRSAGGNLTAEIQMKDESHFQFKLVGAPSNDPGLDFARTLSGVQN
jgi:hypothetical protein